MRIAVIGAGIGGLTLAQALKGSAHEVVVFERDETPEHTGGYRLHVTAEAVQALRRSLPQHLMAAIEASSSAPGSFAQFGVLDHHGVTRLRLPRDPAADDLMIGRQPLRALLATGLDTVRWGVNVSHIQAQADSVAITDDRGAVRSVDLVVGADGPSSRTARDLLDRRPAPGIGVSAIAGMTPLTDDLQAPDDLHRGPAFAIGPHGVGMFLTEHVVRPDADDTPHAIREDPYLVWSTAARRLPSSGPDPEPLRSAAIRAINGWAPFFRDLVERSYPPSIARYDFRRTERVSGWTKPHVVLIGDAVHAMPPTAGAGASTAIVDATVLAEELGRPQSLAAANTAYQKRMLGYAPDAIASSATALRFQRAFECGPVRITGTRAVLPLLDYFVNRSRK